MSVLVAKSWGESLEVNPKSLKPLAIRLYSWNHPSDTQLGNAWYDAENTPEYLRLLWIQLPGPELRLPGHNMHCISTLTISMIYKVFINSALGTPPTGTMEPAFIASLQGLKIKTEATGQRPQVLLDFHLCPPTTVGPGFMKNRCSQYQVPLRSFSIIELNSSSSVMCDHRKVAGKFHTPCLPVWHRRYQTCMLSWFNVA